MPKQTPAPEQEPILDGAASSKLPDLEAAEKRLQEMLLAPQEADLQRDATLSVLVGWHFADWGLNADGETLDRLRRMSAQLAFRAYMLGQRAGR